MGGKRRSSTKVSCVIISLWAWAMLLFAENTAAATTKSVSHYDQEIQASTRQLEEVRNELDKGREKLKALQQEEGTYLRQIEQIEKNITTSYKYLKMLSDRIDTVETIIKKLNDSLIIAEKKLESRQAVMRKRLRNAYMMGQDHSWLWIFAAASPLDAVNKARYVQELNRYDRNLAKKIEAARREIDEKKRVQQEERNHLSNLLADKENERRSLELEEKQRKTLLAEVQKQKEIWEARVRELETSQKELIAVIKKLEAKRKKAREKASAASIASFEKRKGKLSWPVEGKIIGRFGKVVHPVYGTVIMNTGVDIEASAGDAVKCIAPGTVIHTGSMRGLGKIVIIDHVGGYMSVYAHLQSIDVEPEQSVDEDSIIGRIGVLGAKDEAKLHFEIRRSAEALDPSEWLEKR